MKYYILGMNPVYMEEIDTIPRYFTIETDGTFIEDMTYMLKIKNDLSGDVEEVSKEDFEDYVEHLKNGKGDIWLRNR